MLRNRATTNVADCNRSPHPSTRFRKHNRETNYQKIQAEYMCHLAKIEEEIINISRINKKERDIKGMRNVKDKKRDRIKNKLKNTVQRPNKSDRKKIEKQTTAQ